MPSWAPIHVGRCAWRACAASCLPALVPTVCDFFNVITLLHAVLRIRPDELPGDYNRRAHALLLQWMSCHNVESHSHQVLRAIQKVVAAMAEILAGINQWLQM